MKGRVALVTGGAQGIGAGICRCLCDGGGRVLIVDIQERPAPLVEDLLAAGRAAYLEQDITSDRGPWDAVAEAVARFGGLDVLVNNAAPARCRETVHRLSNADWDPHQALVLSAAVSMVEAARPHLARAGAGAVVNVSSVTAGRVGPDHCGWPYHVSKAALDQLTRYLAAVLGPDGIRVNGVAPGLVDRDGGPKVSDTPVHRDIMRRVVPLGRAATGYEVGKLVRFLASDEASYITGQTILIDGGLESQEVFAAGLRAFNLGTQTGPAM